MSRWASLVVALVAGCAVKHHCGRASPEDLGWILAPTAWLAGLLSGGDFELESGVGWSSRELRFIIAPSCAGVNFLVALFWTLAWTTAGDRAGSGFLREAARLSGCGVAAYLATLAANALRLAVAIAVHAAGPGWLAGPRAHRVLGLAVYLPILFGLARAAAGPSRHASGTLALWIPAACYCAVTIAAPLATGAAASPVFPEHALTVLAGLACALVGLRIATTANRQRF